MTILSALFLALWAAPAAAGPLEEAARGAAALVSAEPRGTEKLFDKSFFRHISLEKLEGIFRELRAANGAVEAVPLVSSAAFSGHFYFDTAEGWRIPVALTVEPGGKITGLFFSPPYRKDAALRDVRKALEALPGRKGFLAARLGGETLEELAADEQFAIGSAFKLYVLGAMLKERTPWTKVVRLREEDRSLPSGRLRNWPAGSPLTAHTLAAMMISESDNTAADALVTELGRRTLEEDLLGLGHSKPVRLRPFLRTSEMFRLKSDTAAALKYLNLPLEDKYHFLDSLAGAPLSADRFPRSPFGVDSLEWFASPADLCRLMDYFRRRGDAQALALLAVNPGLETAGADFQYAGYKGGSEPGVLSMTWLLRSGNSEWYCLAASWNDEKGTLDEEKFYGLMRSALAALAAGRGKQGQ